MRVYAAAITPSELTWTPTWQTVNGEPRALTIPGHEFSGIVATVNGDSDISSGHEVFGIIDDWFADGAQAEFVAAPLRGLARKPKTVDHAQAAVIPISGLTAWQALFDRRAPAGRAACPRPWRRRRRRIICRAAGALEGRRRHRDGRRP